VACMASTECEPIAGSGGRAPSGVKGQRPWSGVREQSPPEAGSILISDAKKQD